MIWEKETKIRFDQIIARIPVFLRSIALDKVSQKTEDLVKAGGRQEVTEKDIVGAFFAVTPFGFHGPLKNDMKEIGIDYEKYGHPQ